MFVAIAFSTIFSYANDIPHELQFNLDNDQETVTFEEDGCQPLLDDETNYYIEQVNDRKFRVGSRKISEKSGSIVFDCPSEPVFIVLRYKNNYSDIFDESRRKSFNRPESEFSVNYFRSDLQESLSLNALDLSYKPFQIVATETDYPRTGFRNRSSSLDITHKLSEFQLGYGSTYQNLTLDNKYSYRSSIGYGSYFANYEILQSADHSIDSKHMFVHLGTPFELNYMLFDDVKAGMSHSLSRTFSNRFSAFLLSLDSNYKRSILKNAPKEDDFLNSFKMVYYQNSNNEVGIENKVDCKHLAYWNCLWQSSEYSYTQVLRWPFNTRATAKYRPFPHSAALESRTQFLYQQAFDLKIEKYFQPIPYFNRYVWIANTMPSTEELFQQCGFTLSYWYRIFKVGATLPLCPKFSPRRANYSVGLDVQEQKWSFVSDVFFTPTQQGKLLWQLSSGAKYYFEKNIDYFRQTLLTTHKIRGKVLSNGLREPVANKKIELQSTEGQVLLTTESKEDGSFEFIDSPPRGTFLIHMENAPEESKQELVKTLQEPHLEIVVTDKIYKPIFFLFFLSNSTTDFSNAKELPLKNYIPEIDDSIVKFENAKNIKDAFFLPIGKADKTIINESLLPAEYKVAKVEPEFFDVSSAEALTLRIFLIKASSQ